MPFRRLLARALALLVLTLFSCATPGLTPLPESMPAARAALQPEYRLFYDTLVDYGDWVLIEPYGFVFRPRVGADAWKPYWDGFWVPTDLYGWVWVSSEPFGWATYHYGQWFYDPYQRWVWLPGLDWAPARVLWQASGTYVGWAPIMPRGASYSSVPGGAFSYVPTAELAATDLKARARSEESLAGRLGQVEPVENLVEEDGVTFNRGPDLDQIERLAGPLRRVRIEDLVPATGAGVGRADAGLRAGASPPASQANPPPASSDPSRLTRRAGEQAARDARALSRQGTAPPARLPVVRPFGVPPSRRAPAPADVAPPPRPAKGRSAEPDSSR